jgi:hypothetical protein
LEFLDGLRQELAFPEIAKTKDWEIRGDWKGTGFLNGLLGQTRMSAPPVKTERQKAEGRKTEDHGQWSTIAHATPELPDGLGQECPHHLE